MAAPYNRTASACLFALKASFPWSLAICPLRLSSADTLRRGKDRLERSEVSIRKVILLLRRAIYLGVFVLEEPPCVPLTCAETPSPAEASSILTSLSSIISQINTSLSMMVSLLLSGLDKKREKSGRSQIHMHRSRFEKMKISIDKL